MAADGERPLLRRLALAASSVVCASVLVIVACGPPPIGWQGAGRLQTLPSPENVDSGSSTDTADTGAEMGMDADQGMDSGADSGSETGSDGGGGSLTDAGKDSASSTKPKDAGADAVDGAHPGNPGQFDGGPDAPLG